MTNKQISNLVIGSEGFVGKAFCDYLESRGERVKRFDIKNSPEQDGRSTLLPLSEKIDRVYFLAWEVGGAKYLYREDIQFIQLDSNLRLMLNVFPQLQQSRLPFLFVSSQLAEECDTVYGVTKRLGEVWTQLLHGTRLRLWNVYGAYEPASERSHVVADFIWQAISHGEIRMLTTGDELRQFIYIDDVCRAFYGAFDRQFSGVYDVSNFEWVSVRSVAEIIGSITGAKVFPGEILGSTPITPMRGKVPNWNPTVGLEEGLKRTISLFKSYQKLDGGNS